nr:hypothetical protein [uncultured Flavobacterium sp.]
MRKKLISISYTLYGRNYDYYLPIVKQFDFFNVFFKETLNSEYEFEIVVFIDNSVDLSYFNELPIQFIMNTDHVLLSDVPPKMWRFYNIFFTKADVYLFRDSDSVISKRELSLLKTWLDSKYDYNVIRDTRLHLYPIMAGTFSIKQSGIELFKNVLSENPCLIKNRKHFYDQIYLAEILYPKIISNLLVFSNFLVFKKEHYIKTDYRTKDFIGGYYLNNELEKHWHDFKFVEDFPLRSLKIMKYSTRLVLLYISCILLKKRISF